MAQRKALPYWLSAVVLCGLAVLVTVAPLALRALAPHSSAHASKDAGSAPSQTLPAGALGDTVQVGDMLVTLTTTSGQPRVGLNELHAVVTDAAGQAVRDAKVALDIDMTNMSHGLYMVDCQCGDDGHYSGQANFTMAGPWRIHVSIQRPGEPAVTARFTFRVDSA